MFDWLNKIFGKKIENSDQDESQMSCDEMMVKMAELAVSNAEKVEFQLDYSETSFENVESILSQLYEDHLKDPIDPKTLQSFAYMYGAYVGEVVRKMRPGSWSDFDHRGQKVTTLSFDSQNEIYPCSWCYNRITVGPEDNIKSKVESLKQLGHL